MNHSIDRILCAAFCLTVVLANLLSAKMVDLPFVSLAIPAGLVIYPLAFVLSTMSAELFGPRRARQMVSIAFAMNLFAFALIEIVLWLPDASEGNQFQKIFGLSRLRILSSLLAFFASQMTEVSIYQAIRRKSAGQLLWLRTGGAVCIGQLVDTLVIDLLYLPIGLGMGIGAVTPIIFFSYAYKILFTLGWTPFFCFIMGQLRRGKRRQEQRKMLKLSEFEVASNMKHLSSRWATQEEKMLTATFSFHNFREAIAFTNAVGGLAEQMDHHPDFRLSYESVELQIWSHDIGALSVRDFLLAKEIDRLKPFL